MHVTHTIFNTIHNCVTTDNLRLAALLVSGLKSTGKDILIRQSVFTNFYSHGFLYISVVFPRTSSPFGLELLFKLFLFRICCLPDIPDISQCLCLSFRIHLFNCGTCFYLFHQKPYHRSG